MLRGIKDASTKPALTYVTSKKIGRTPMASLSIDPDYLRRLVLKVRSFMGKEATEVPDEGSNPTDDAMPSSALQEEPDDLSREEVVEEIRGLAPRQQAELVALMWLGRDDGRLRISPIS